MPPHIFLEKTTFSIRQAGIITKKSDPIVDEFALQVRKWLVAERIEVLMNEITPDLDILIILGGDGTLLHVAEKAAFHSIPILGINLGSLGFLTELAEHEAREALDEILNGPVIVENRMMLKTRIIRQNETEKYRLSLNEVAVSKDAVDRLLHLSTSADGMHITSYKADGLLFSTPTGSTAYNLSAGGPLVYPGLPSILVTPICPFMLGSRPILLPAETRLATRFSNPDATSCAQIIIDGKLAWPMCAEDILEVETAEKGLQLIASSHKNYFSILRNKLHWGNQKDDDK